MSINTTDHADTNPERQEETLTDEERDALEWLVENDDKLGPLARGILQSAPEVSRS